jgi:hypothetical protein
VRAARLARKYTTVESPNRAHILLRVSASAEERPSLRPLRWSAHLNRSVASLAREGLIVRRFPGNISWERQWRLTALGHEVADKIRCIDWDAEGVYSDE